MSDKTHREKLTELGGWDNSLVSVNAGSVKEIIVELENAEKEITKLKQDRKNEREAAYFLYEKLLIEHDKLVFHCRELITAITETHKADAMFNIKNYLDKHK